MARLRLPLSADNAACWRPIEPQRGVERATALPALRKFIILPGGDPLSQDGHHPGNVCPSCDARFSRVAKRHAIFTDHSELATAAQLELLGPMPRR